MSGVKPCIIALQCYNARPVTTLFNKYFLIFIIAILSFAYPPYLFAKTAAKISFSSQNLKQGEVLLVNVEDTHGIKMLSGSMFNKPVNFYKNVRGSKYSALIGIDMDTKPDRYKLTLTIEDRNGKTRKEYQFRIKSANFGTQKLTLPPSKVTLDEETLKQVDIEKEKIGRVWEIFTEDRLWNGKFLPPVAGDMSDDFGLRRIINGEQKSPHTGVDVDAPEGAPVKASNSGRAIFKDDQFFSGKTLIIDHGLGLFTMYFHLSEILVEEGAYVKKGEVVAKVGKTGRATGPHLHWGVRLNNARINPLSIINLKSLE
ncbi:MAG: M23 family metallopeptidase [Nitrospirae bacterium]|nr:M23 family metallopeptidase [Nitrospirota bacterium]